MYTRENYKKVKDIIDSRRQKAISDAEERNFEVQSLSSEIKEIDKELRGVGLLLFKTACGGGDIDLIRKRNQALCKQRENALLALGLPIDYTEPKYTCKKCSDSGFIETKLCDCFKEALIKENINSSGMNKLMQKQSFDNFDIERYKDNAVIYKKMKHHLMYAKNFAENFEDNKSKTVLFIGKTGTGKTHLTTAIARRVLECGYEVLYESTQNILAEFEEEKFRSGYGHREPITDKYLECELLIMDDLGTEFSTQFSLSCLYNIINTRQNRGLATIISTNISLEALRTTYDDRITSRILGCDADVLLFEGYDQRIATKLNKV